MSDILARPNRLPWPPLIYLAAIAASVLLHMLAPLAWLPSPISDIFFAVGWLFVAGAAMIDISAMRMLHRSKTTILPHRGSDHLVTGGAYSFSRNPIYLANTMIMFGAGFISGIIWFFPLALIAAFATQKLAIEREEKHLEARFGKKFREYAKRVRRWI